MVRLGYDWKVILTYNARWSIKETPSVSEPVAEDL